MFKSHYMELSIPSPLGISGCCMKASVFNVIVIFHGSVWTDLSHSSSKPTKVPGDVLAPGVFDYLGQNFMVKALNLTISQQKNKVVGLFLEKFEMKWLKSLMDLEECKQVRLLS